MQVLEVLRAQGSEYLLYARMPNRSEDVLVRLYAIDPADPLGAARELRSFEKRAEVASALRHPGILAAGPLQRRDDLAYYVVQDALERTLDSVLAEGVLLPLDRVLVILRDIAAAVDYAASVGVVHGQLDPSVIVMRAAGRALVADFGAGNGIPLARSGRAAVYRAPELWQRDAVPDARSDVYALGVMAYEMLSGRRRAMSRGAQGVVIVDAIPLTHDAPIRAGAPLYMNDPILRALSKRPAARFARAEELVEMLDGRSLSPLVGLPTQHPSVGIEGPRRIALAPLAIAIVIGIGIGIVATPAAREIVKRSGHTSLADEITVPPSLAPVSTSSSTSESGSTATSAPSSGSASGTPGPIFPNAATAAGPQGRQSRVSVGAPTSTGTVNSSPQSAAGALALPGGASSVTLPPFAQDSAPPGYIRVEYDGLPALVMIDELPRGRTPYIGRAQPGAHAIRLVGSKAEFPVQQVRVTGGDTAIASFSDPRAAP